MWDFPLMNVASAMVISGGKIERIRMAVNGVAAHPLRLKAVEAAVRRQAAERGHRRSWPGNSPSGAPSLCAQRLQDSADAKSGEARHPWSGAEEAAWTS